MLPHPSSDRRQALQKEAHELARDARALPKVARAPAARSEARMRLRGRETTLAEAEDLRLDDLKEISVKESRKGSCTYRMDGASATGRGRRRERREDRRRKSPPEG